MNPFFLGRQRSLLEALRTPAGGAQGLGQRAGLSFPQTVTLLLLEAETLRERRVLFLVAWKSRLSFPLPPNVIRLPRAEPELAGLTVRFLCGIWVGIQTHLILWVHKAQARGREEDISLRCLQRGWKNLLETLWKTLLGLSGR